jgi:hypothetical protein
LSCDAVREEPGRDLSTWTLDQLQTLIQNTCDEWLETARLAAQGHAYDSSHPLETRRQWAKLSLLANRRMLPAGEGYAHPRRATAVRVAHQEFMLRMWVIEQLGLDDTDPDWSPKALASDTLDALTFTPAQAAALADGWSNLAIKQIRELRWHKNLTAHVERLVGYLAPGPIHDQLLTWTATRQSLP